jgi:hypothetical protein
MSNGETASTRPGGGLADFGWQFGLREKRLPGVSIGSVVATAFGEADDGGN